MNKALLILAVLGLGVGFQVRAETCRYVLEPGSVQVNWTAFKTMQRLAVNGAFTEVSILGELEDKTSFTHLLSQLEGEIGVKDASLIRTGNPGRDMTLFQHFFSRFKKTPVLSAAIQEVRGDDKSGEFALSLKMNRKTKPVLMHYQRNESGVFEARGSLDVLDFGLSEALQDLHKTCEVLHRGPDGVSKTWPLVELKLVARIGQTCKP
jgi:hypothetical protein